IDRDTGVSAEASGGHDYAQLFRAENAKLYRSLYAYTGGRRDIAEDAAVEAFARAISEGERVRDPVPWLSRTAFRIAAAELNGDTPRSMSRRVQEGPRNEPPIGLPPRRQRTAAAAVALAVFVAAVVFAWQGLRPNTTPGGSSSPTPPPGKAVYTDPLGWTAF